MATNPWAQLPVSTDQPIQAQPQAQAQPQSWAELPVQKSVPAAPFTGVNPTQTYNGKQSVQRSDGAVWYGPEQGNTGQAGWFDAKGNRAGDAPGQAPRDSWAGRALSALGGAAQVQQSAPGMSGLTPEASQLAATSLSGPAQQAARFYSHVAPNWAGAQGAGNLVNQIQANKQRIISQDPSGAASAASGLGDMGVQIGLAELLGLPGAVSKLGAMGAMGGAGWLAGAFNAARTSAIAGGLFGAQNALTNPSGVDTSNRSLGGLPSYIARGGKEVLDQGSMGTAFGFGLSAIGEAIGAAPGAIKSGAGATARLISGTRNVTLPPEITNGESVSDVMASVRHDPDLGGKDIADIQRIAAGDKIYPDTQKAEQVVQRLTYAGAGEHGVDLSLGDVSGDAQLRLREQALESKPGSVMNDFRAKQGGQLRNAVMTLRDEADTEVHGIGLEGAPKFGFEETNGEPKPTLDWAVRDAQRARSAGTIGSNLTEPEILAHKISSMEAYPSNPKAIQLSLEGQGWQNRQIDKLNHDSINDSINTSLEQNPNLPKTVDVGPVVSKLDDLIRQNRKSPAYSSDLDSQLNAYRSNLTGGEVKDLSYDNVHHAVSSMERTIADLKEGGNRNLVSNLQQVKNLLDFQKEKFATQTLRDQPDMLDDIRSASDFHKDNVVPYQDPDHGIRQIIEGKDPDKAVKSLFTDSSPDEFKRIFDKLDSKGQNAVRAEMIGRSEDSSSRMKNFNELNLPGMARYVENRSDQVKTAFGDDYTLAGLANLIRNTPRAGYQSKLDNLFNINSLKGLSAKSIGALGGYAAGGPVGAIAGTALETGAEMGANRAISSHLTDPKAIASYAEPHGAQLGSSLEPSPIRYAADEQPPRSVGAAGRPTKSPTTFESPQANPNLTFQGKAGAGYADPYATLKSAQDAHAAAQGETQFSRNNLTEAISQKRDLTNQISRAKDQARAAFEASGGVRPTGWGTVDRDMQHQAYDAQGRLVDPYDPNEPQPPDLMAGSETREIQEFWRNALGSPKPTDLRGNVVREPSPDEMRGVADRISNWMNYLKKSGISGKEEVLVPNNSIPQHLPGAMDPFASVPLGFHAGTRAELQAEHDGMAQTRDSVLDFARRTENGEFPQASQKSMELINDLSTKTKRVQDLQQALRDQAASPINVKSLQQELSDAQANEAHSFQVLRNTIHRQPQPANNPSTAIPASSMTAPVQGGGSTINNPRGIQTSTQGVPVQSLGHMAEPYGAPRSGAGASAFDVEGNRSVGAAEYPFDRARREADQANRSLSNVQRGIIPMGPPQTPPTPLEAATKQMDAVRAQYARSQQQVPSETVSQQPPQNLITQARTQPDMNPTGLKAKMLALFGLHPAQQGAGGTDKLAQQGAGGADKLAQQMIDENPEMADLLKGVSFRNEQRRQYSQPEQNLEAAKLLSARFGRPIESYLNVPEPNSEADVSAAQQFTKMFEEETRNLRTQHQQDIKDALANRATPAEIKSLKSNQAGIINKRNGWNSIAKKLAVKGSDEEWTEHMKGMPQ